MFPLLRPANTRTVSPSQKICDKCHFVMDIEVSRCLSCGHSPWIWRSSVRVFVLMVLLAVTCLLLGRALTTQEQVYRVPMVAPSPEQRE